VADEVKEEEEPMEENEDGCLEDDDEEDDEEEADGSGGGRGNVDLTGFLFGNLNEEGQLDAEDANFLDRDTRAKLGGLGRLLGNSQTNDDELQGILKEKGEEEEEGDEDYEESQKDPLAEDFSNIQEGVSDDDSSSDEEEEEEERVKNGSDEDKRKDKIEPKEEAKPAVVKEEPKEEEMTIEDQIEVKHEPIENQEKEASPSPSEAAKPKEKEDEQLMPPPATAPASKQAAAKQEPPAAEPPPQSKAKPEPTSQRRPLAGMLPEKYKDTDVRELFPEFRQNEVLRFSRLFPIKPSHRPKIWKNLKRKKPEEMPAKVEHKQEYDENGEPKEFEWKFQFAELPDDPSAYAEDGLNRLMRPQEEGGDEATEEDEEEDAQAKRRRRGPKETDWRTGPAQYWYDMTNVPENAEDYDYGLKLALGKSQSFLSNNLGIYTGVLP